MMLILQISILFVVIIKPIWLYNHLDSKFEILENPTLIKENILNQCLEKWVQEKEFYDFIKKIILVINLILLKKFFFN